MHNPAVWPWRSDGAIALNRLGQNEHALDLIEEELRIARRYGLARSVGITVRRLGLVTEGEQGIELQRQAVKLLRSSPARLELARSLVDLGARLRRDGERSAARLELRQGLELARSLSLRAIKERARRELEASGARIGRIELSGPESLTPSERRVAELAASGETNREIAQQLFVSLRTVETHLTHAYRKLDIHSRQDLARVMDGGTGRASGSTIG